jgi:hypothetical protein
MFPERRLAKRREYYSTVNNCGADVVAKCRFWREKPECTVLVGGSGLGQGISEQVFSWTGMLHSKASSEEELFQLIY